MTDNEDMRLEAINVISTDDVRSYEIGAPPCPDAESWGTAHIFSLPPQNHARRALSGLSANVTSPRKSRAKRLEAPPSPTPPKPAANKRKREEPEKDDEDPEEKETKEKPVLEMTDKEFDEWMEKNKVEVDERHERRLEAYKEVVKARNKASALASQRKTRKK